MTDVNVFSTSMNLSQMIDLTSEAQWTQGDILSWSKAAWTFSGSVEEKTDQKTFTSQKFPNLF